MDKLQQALNILQDGCEYRFNNLFKESKAFNRKYSKYLKTPNTIHTCYDVLKSLYKYKIAVTFSEDAKNFFKYLKFDITENEICWIIKI